MQIDKPEIECLGFQLTHSGGLLLILKVQGIAEELRQTNLKELRSPLGAVNQLNKFVPDLASICFPFRTRARHGIGYQNIKKRLRKQSKK